MRSSIGLGVQRVLAIFCLSLFVLWPPVGASASLQLTDSERAWLDQHSRISVAFDGNFPPHSFIDETGEWQGTAVDVFKLIGEKLPLEFEIHPQHVWKDLYSAALERRVDVVATMVKKDEREQHFLFTDVYIPKSLMIVTDSNNQRLNTRADLNEKTVALIKGYSYVTGILQEFPNIQPYYVDTMLQAFEAVSTGRADAAISFFGAAHYLRTKYLLSNLRYAAIYEKDSSFERIGIRNDWPELQSILNKALQSISQDSMQAIRSKWLPEAYEDLLVEIPLTDAERAWIKAHRDIRLGVDPEFAPFEFLQDGSYRGMASDYIKLLNQRLNLNMQVVPNLTWDEAVEAAKNRNVDVLPAVGRNSSREQYLDFTDPYLEFFRVVITRIDAPAVYGLGDLEGMRVGVQKNSSHQGYLQENSQIEPVLFETLKASLLAVSTGQIDAFVGNVASATYWIQQTNLSNLKVAAPVSQEIQKLHFAVRNDWPELTAILQKGLDSISSDQRAAISRRWMNVELDPRIDYSIVWKVAAAFSLLLLAALFWNITLNRKVRQRSQQLLRSAYYDDLTQLPNRILMTDRLKQRISDASHSQHKLALMIVDLDDFKTFNESIGHQAGDCILQQAAQRLRDVSHENITIGRLGADRYLMIASDLKAVSAAADLARETINALTEKFLVQSHELALTASAGVAIFPEDGLTADDLMKHAESAVRAAKSQGHASIAFYRHELQAQASRRLELDEQLRTALDKNEIQIVYQPKWQLNSGSMMGFEALLRWHNEKLGEVSPSEFIPLAEANGMIHAIGEFALVNSLSTLAEIMQSSNQKLSMAVNLSPVQFQDKHLIRKLDAVIRQTGIDPSCLELEITEGVLMNGGEQLEFSLKRIAQMNIVLTMDDFGTGYSSLSYLRRYTFQVLKIDKEFIQDLGKKEAAKKLVAATIAMAHNLDIKVVAEGIENQMQSEILSDCGCDIAQGFLFGRPQTKEEILAALNTSLYVREPANDLLSNSKRPH